jgi:phosphoribosyl 1,2-cyclic phosphodiesterase
MSLFIASLNSGSNGNCYYLGNQDEAILVDGGISCRETERRMKRLELSMKKVKAIFISHEHADHIYGVSRLSRRHQLPVYITEATRKGGRIVLRDQLTKPFRAYEAVTIGNLMVTPFPKYHDASDPHSFIVACKDVKVGIFTDIGRACENVVRHFEQCNAAFLESNYDEKMLEAGRYPAMLKNRIRDGRGHLSNNQALQLFMNHRPQAMSHLFLSHLSHNNNTPRIVKEMFSAVAGPTKILIAPRDKPTQVYHIRNIPGYSTRRNTPVTTEQLSLF